MNKKIIHLQNHLYSALVFGDDARAVTPATVIDTNLAVEAKILMHGGTVIHAQLLNKNKIIGNIYI